MPSYQGTLDEAGPARWNFAHPVRSVEVGQHENVQELGASGRRESIDALSERLLHLVEGPLGSRSPIRSRCPRVVLVDEPADDPTSANICHPRNVGNGADRIRSLKVDPEGYQNADPSCLDRMVLVDQAA